MQVLVKEVRESEYLEVIAGWELKKWEEKALHLHYHSARKEQFSELGVIERPHERLKNQRNEKHRLEYCNLFYAYFNEPFSKGTAA